MTGTVDYSWSYPGAGTIAGAGYIGAERYLGDDGRCLTGWERDELAGAGVGIGLIFESAADRSLDGYWAGHNDATDANDWANDLGAPAWVPIRYATDFHANQAQIDGPITDYYRGANDYGGRPVAVYGGAPVIDRMAAVLGLRSGWQAAAASWSNYVLSPNAVLLQEVEQIWGGAADTNIVLCPDDDIDWLWGRSEGDWFSMATEDDLRRVVNECLNSKLAEFYTGQRAVAAKGDGRVFEVLRDPTHTGGGEGALVRRYIPRPAQTKLLRYIDGLAEAGFDGDVRTITDPEMLDEFNALPIIGLAEGR